MAQRRRKPRGDQSRGGFAPRRIRRGRQVAECDVALVPRAADRVVALVARAQLVRGVAHERGKHTMKLRVAAEARRERRAAAPRHLIFPGKRYGAAAARRQGLRIDSQSLRVSQRVGQPGRAHHEARPQQSGHESLAALFPGWFSECRSQ